VPAAPQPSLQYRQFDTPFGVLSVVCDPHAAGDSPAGPSGPVVASGFGSVAEVLNSNEARPSAGELPEIAEAVAAYLAGDIAALDRVAVAQTGSPFRVEAWRAMRQIPAGEVRSYAELAADAGRPGAARAAGSACATNTVAPFVPCHRIVRSGGSLGQYGYGLDTKKQLLRHEGYLRQ
jgi:methylated-DNA-[protein]-cysteine S-methyltransferase